MTRTVYVSLELDHDIVGRIAACEDDHDQSDRFLDYLAGSQSYTGNAEARELESFLRQRQTHVLGRADRY